MSNYASLIDEYSELIDKQKEIRERLDAIQSLLITESEKALADTKYHSVDFYGTDGDTITVTDSGKLDIISTEYLRKIFGDISKDIIKETVKCEISKDFQPIIKAAISGEYVKGSALEDVLKSATSDDGQLKALRKKIKGSYDKDVANFCTICGCTRAEAKNLAYLAAEAINWQRISAFLTVSGYSEDQFAEIIEKLRAAVILDESVKVTYTKGE